MYFDIREILRVENELFHPENRSDRLDVRHCYAYWTQEMTNFMSNQNYCISKHFYFVSKLYQRDTSLYLRHEETNGNIYSWSTNEKGFCVRDKTITPQQKEIIIDSTTAEFWREEWTKYVNENNICSLDHGTDFRKFSHHFNTGYYKCNFPK